MKKLSVSLGVVVLIILSACSVWFLSNDHHAAQKTKEKIAKQPQLSFADKKIASMTLRQKVASLLILHDDGNDTTVLNQYLADYQPSGLIFMSDNIGSMSSSELGEITTQLQTDPELPYLFAIDEEGGTVRRLNDDTYLSALDLKNQSPEATESAFSERSIMLKTVGMNLNFGIIADVTDNPNSFIYPRVFGNDSTSASMHVAAAVSGEKGNVLSTLKHYPGHGETTADSHYSIPTTDISYKEWQKNDEKPFISGIKAGAQVVMFGHLVYSSVDSQPASLSAKWHEILRQRDGFTGIAITDDMTMLQDSSDSNYTDPIKNAVDAINAGNTMLLYVLGTDDISPNDLIDGVVSAVDKDIIKQDTIDANVKQILELRHGLAN